MVAPIQETGRLCATARCGSAAPLGTQTVSAETCLHTRSACCEIRSMLIPGSMNIMTSRILYLFLILLLAGPAAGTENSTSWHVVLAAVGNEQQVFDNFVLDFAGMLGESTQVASLTTLHASVDERWKPSGIRVLEEALASLRPGEGEACLVYLTGHGAPEGLAMSADVPTVFVRTTRMESMLRGCTGRPTVLVVSSCFSGVYMQPSLTRPERIVITASAANLPSFGCSNNNRYTFFDQCFLDAWAGHEQWGALADTINRCVRETERSKGFPDSKPQFFFGPGLRELALP